MTADWSLGAIAAICALIVLVAGGAGTGAYLLAKSGAEDPLEQARDEGAAAGRAEGEARGAEKGYSEGYEAGREKGFNETYPDAYRAAYAAEFKKAKLDRPKKIEVPALE